MTTGILSTYSTGENRVTASILAVLKSLSLDRIQRLLGALLEESEFELVTFSNQPCHGGDSVPDAEIVGSIRLLIETKIKRNAVREKQLQEHLKVLAKAREANRILLVLTPDERRPKAFDSLESSRLVWSSFSALDQAIDEILADKYEVVSEREAFLLRELQAMLVAEGVVPGPNAVVVVAARHAWPEYQRHHAYICQADRAFQPVSHIAFYSHGQIYPLVPVILEKHNRVEFRPEAHKGWLGEIMKALAQDPENTRKIGEAFMFIRLSADNAPETIKLDKPIPNDLTSEAGQPRAFTQGQRYVSLEKLRKAKKTSDCVSEQ